MSFACLLLSHRGGEAANILISAVFADGSHFLTCIPIAKSLLQRGHNVTFLVPESFLPNARNSVADPDLFHFELFRSAGLKENITTYYRDNLGDLGFSDSKWNDEINLMREFFTSFYHAACEDLFEDHELLGRLREYDGYVIDVTWLCGVYVKAYLAKYTDTKNISVTIVAPMAPLPYIFEEAGSPFMPSYQPLPGTKLSSSMSFSERFKNTMTYLICVLLFDTPDPVALAISGAVSGLVKKYDLDPHLRRRIGKYVDLYLMNSDFSVEFPFPLMPNVIPVGGLTSGPAKPLDKDLEEFMKSSGDHGVVLYSLGSYYASITLSRPHIIKMFVDAFSRIPQKVILHLKEPPSYELPDNMMMLPWLPLNDLLGHPKTRALLYHGGNNGFYEALYHAVPLILMPLVGDQDDVAVRAVSGGIGIRIDKRRLSSDYIYEQINEVLTNPKYQNNANRLSAIFRDRPMGPSDTAAFWIEHVIEHGGDHLRPITQIMSFFQIYSLDVAAVIVMCISFCYLVVKHLVGYCFRKGKAKTKRE
ncbi:UDP-glucuronosyltransferase 2C1-like [Diadema setosum]|uniref:UDP-glucuronosyltransferase 2C1-like n=1 Tax=Diadema setosum TaxID=31175 RepID=UPI003B3A4BBC